MLEECLLRQYEHSIILHKNQSTIPRSARGKTLFSGYFKKVCSSLINFPQCNILNMNMKKRTTWIWIFCALLIVGGVAAAIGMQMARQKKAQRDAWVNSPVIHEGITVGGVAVGGLTPAQAEQAIREALAEEFAAEEAVFCLDGEERRASYAAMGISIDCAASAQTAYAWGREGSYGELKAEIERLAAGQESSLSYCLDEAQARQTAAEWKTRYDTLATDAWLEAQDGQLIYHEEQAGRALSEAGAVSALREGVQEGEIAMFVLPVERIEPERKLADITPGLVRRAKAETSFGGTADNRGKNIEKAIALLDGHLLYAGQECSMNEILGDRTAANGWLPAPAIVEGGAQREDQPGGGVCQVSTTLYNAVAKADLEVTARRCHSAKVNYVKTGLDATVNTGTIDFRWKNNTEGDAFIHAWIEDGTKVCVEVYALPFAGFDEIKLESEHTGDIEPEGEMEVVYDGTKEKGFSEVEVPRQKGETYTSYKVYYCAGKEVRREKLADSKYRAQRGRKVVGTK